MLDWEVAGASYQRVRVLGRPMHGVDEYTQLEVVENVPQLVQVRCRHTVNGHEEHAGLENLACRRTRDIDATDRYIADDGQHPEHLMKGGARTVHKDMRSDGEQVPDTASDVDFLIRPPYFKVNVPIDTIVHVHAQLTKTGL